MENLNDKISSFIKIDSHGENTPQYWQDNGTAIGNDEGYGYKRKFAYGKSNDSYLPELLKYNDYKRNILTIGKYNNQDVYLINNTPFIFKTIIRNYAYGYVINDDLTLSEKYVSKVDNSFGFGNTVRDSYTNASLFAVQAVPYEKRIDKFIDNIGTLNSEYTGKQFYQWHYYLTGACQSGRDEFMKLNNIDYDKKYTVKYFLDIVKDKYGSNIINQIYMKLTKKTIIKYLNGK